MTQIIKEILTRVSGSIDCSLMIAVGDKKWLDQARSIGSLRTFITEPHPQRAAWLSRYVRTDGREQILNLATTWTTNSEAVLNVFNDPRHNNSSADYRVCANLPNVKKVGELTVPAMSLSKIVERCELDYVKENCLILASIGDSADLVSNTPNYYLKKFSWIIIRDDFQYSEDNLFRLQKSLQLAGFSRVATDPEELPWTVELYRRNHRDDLYSATALDKILLQQQILPKDKIPQHAFDSYYTYKQTKSRSNLVAACIESTIVGNFGAAQQLIADLSILDADDTSANLLKQNLAMSKVAASLNTVPDISVIIPYHNREKAVRECLESVLNQSLKNIEILVVDDGSSDSSRNEVAKLIDPRLIMINCDIASGNSGTPRNLALRRARGKYVAFVDSDDTIDKLYLEQLWRTAESTDAEITIARSFAKLHNDAQGNQKRSKISYVYKPNFIADGQKKFFFINSFVIWDKLYRRSFLSTNSIKLAESKIGADTLMVAKVYYFANKISFCTNTAYYNYNAFSEGSVTQAYRSRGDIKEEDRPYAETFRWLSEQNISRPYVLIQWIRRLMSLSYCLSSNKGDIQPESLSYLNKTLKEAPFKSALTHLKRKGLHEQYASLQQLMKMLGRKVIDV